MKNLVCSTKAITGGNIAAIASISKGDFYVNYIKIVNGKNGQFIAMPSRKTKDGNYRDIVHPITKEGRVELSNLIITEFKTPSTHEKVTPQEPTIKVRVTKYVSNKTVGLATLILDDELVIEGIKIIDGKNGLFASMPQIKKASGEYADICYIKTKELKEKIQETILEVYSAKSDNEVSEECSNCNNDFNPGDYKDTMTWDIQTMQNGEGEEIPF